MEQRPKPVMRRVHVSENKLDRTRVVTMSGVLKGATPDQDLRVWCEEHWKVPTDNALEKELVHCAWWTTDRNRASSSFDAAMLAMDTDEVEPAAAMDDVDKERDRQFLEEHPALIVPAPAPAQ